MRKLAWFALPFSAAVFLCVYLLPQDARLPAAAALAALALSAGRLCAPKIKPRAVLALLGAAAGLVWSFGYTQIFYLPAQQFAGQTVQVSAVVIDYPQTTDYGVSVSVKLETQNGVKVKSLLYADGEYAFLQPGDELSFTAACKLSNLRRGEEYLYYQSKGVYLILNARGEITVSSPVSVPLRYVPQRIARALKGEIGALYDASAAGLIQALVTGDKSGLSDELYESLSRDGLSHVVAVSGMHLSILMMVFTTVLGKYRRRTAAVSAAVILLFIAVVGGTPSVVRAGILQLFLLSAPLLHRERDEITTMSCALFVLLCQNPFSAMNVGLQLSFASVAGILLFADRFSRFFYSPLAGRKGVPRPLSASYGFFTASMGTTLAALVFSLPISAYYFGIVSLVAPLSNLLALWAVSAAFVLGMFSAVLGLLWGPLGAVLAAGNALFAKYLLWLIPLLARPPFAAVSLRSWYYGAWLFFLYALVCLCFLWRGKRRLLTPACCGVCGLCAAILFTGASFRSGDMTAAVLDVGQGESVLLGAEDRLALVDCGGNADDNAGDIAADYIENMGCDTLDLLVLTHYHADHANGIPELFRRLKVETVALPDVTPEDSLRAEIVSAAEEAGTQILWIQSDTTVILGGGFSVQIYAPLGSGTTNEEGLSVLASVGEFDTLITGDMDAEVEARLLEHTSLPDVELLVAGHHGSKTSTSQALLDAIRPDVAVISVGYNTYGHPDQEVLQRLADAGAAIRRTDQQGTVVVKSRDGETRLVA